MFEKRIVAVCVALSALPGCASGPPAVVPDVVGLDVEAATARLAEADFGSLVSGGPSCTASDDLTGKVIDQRPDAGAQQKTKSVVSLTVDCGAS